MRREPYTEAGLRRVPCARCGVKPSHANWSICADGEQVRALCAACDVGMNEIAMRYVFGDSREADLDAYHKRVLGDQN